MSEVIRTIYRMNLADIFEDKALKQKPKVAMIGGLLLERKLRVDELIVFAEKSGEVQKATCIESIELATKKEPTIATEKCLKFITKSLSDESPRVKWEAAKVIGNIASVFPTKLKPAIKALLVNADDAGTVVRWATAYALAEILKLKTNSNKELLPTMEAIAVKEKDNGVKKKYLDALKKVKN